MNGENKSIYLHDLAREIWKKWWVLLLALVLFATASYYFTLYMITPIYRASTTIFIGSDGRALTGLTIADINLGQRLTADYRELIGTDRVIRDVLNRLPAEHRNVNIRGNLSVHVGGDSRFLRIFFEDPNPERAALILNNLANVLIRQAEEIVGVRNVQVVDYAQIPHFPVRPNLANNVFVAGLLGVILAVLIILFRLVYSNTVKRQEDVEHDLGLSVLAVIPKTKDISKKNNGLFALHKPNSLMAESYRIFRTNLSYLSIDREVKTIIFTSPSMDEGKTSSVANLAVTMAQAGKKVLLMDCDLRKGRIHGMFSLNRAPGLTNYLTGSTGIDETVKKVEHCANLQVLTTGDLPPNPSDILSSRAFEEFVLEARGMYDYVFIDTPPVLAVADTAVACRLADGVVLAAAVNGTKRADLIQAHKNLANLGASVLGVLLTKDNTFKHHGYYAYRAAH